MHTSVFQRDRLLYYPLLMPVTERLLYLEYPPMGLHDSLVEHYQLLHVELYG